jgi:hypothetical protein
MCTVCQNSPAKIACKCSGQILLLGDCCAIQHFVTNLNQHQTLDISHAIQLLYDEGKMRSFRDSSEGLLKACHGLENYRDELTLFKTSILASREKLANLLLETTDSYIIILEQLEEDIRNKMNFMSFYSEESIQMLNKFHENGVYGILDYAPRYFTIKEDQATSIIKRLIYFGDEPYREENYSELSNLREDFETQVIQINSFNEKLGNELEKTKQDNANLQRKNLALLKKLRKAKEPRPKEQELSAKLEQYEKQIMDLQKSMVKRRRRRRIVEEPVRTRRRRSRRTAKTEELNALDSAIYNPIVESKDTVIRIKPLDQPIPDLKNDSEEDTSFTFEEPVPEYEQYSIRSDNTEQIIDIVYLENRPFPYVLTGEEKDLLDKERQSLVKNKVQRAEHYKKYAYKRYLYLPCNYTNALIQYDTFTERYEHIGVDFCNNHFQFAYTSICQLPNGDVFIAGGIDIPASLKEVFIYKISYEKCVQLPNMINARSRGTVYYYKSEVYVFGGINGRNSANFSKVEKFNFKKGVWVSLPRLIKPRHSSACIDIDTKIYVIAGYNQKTIEEFDTLTNTFKLMNITTNYYSIVSFVHNEKIYLISDQMLQIYDKKFRLLEANGLTNERIRLNNSNSALFANKFIYYSHNGIDFRIECFDCLTKQVITYSPLK